MDGRRIKEGLLTMPLDEFLRRSDAGVRIRHALRRHLGGEATVADLLACDHDDLLNIKNFGRHSAEVLRRVLWLNDLVVTTATPVVPWDGYYGDGAAGEN